jgi:hypothetical protein
MHSSMDQPFTRTTVHKCLGTGTAFGGIFDLPAMGGVLTAYSKAGLSRPVVVRQFDGLYNFIAATVLSRNFSFRDRTERMYAPRWCVPCGLFREKALLYLIHFVCEMAEDM